MTDFYVLLTNTGKAKIANAHASNIPLDLVEMAVGDGNGQYYNPTETQTGLVNEVYRGGINEISVDDNNDNWLVCNLVIPSDVGGFTVREVGLFDSAGDLISIAKYPESYKPVLADGSAKDLMIKMITEVTNTEAVTLKIDPSIILATRDFVGKSIDENNENYYTKNQVDISNNNFYTKSESDLEHNNHYTKEESDQKHNNHYTKEESDQKHNNHYTKDESDQEHNKGQFQKYNPKINYIVGSWVTGSNGFQYYCRVANGPASSVIDPVGNPTTWKLGSNNNTLVVGGDSAIDGGADLQIANETTSVMDISTGGTGGQGSARKSMFFQNTDADNFMDIDCYDNDLSTGVPLRINPNGGLVGIGKTPAAGVELDVQGDIAASGSLSGSNLGVSGGVVSNGKSLTPANYFQSKILDTEINTSNKPFNSLYLDSVEIGDTFMLTVGINGSRSEASELCTDITTSGVGRISGPFDSDDISNQYYSIYPGSFKNCFSSLCVVTDKGTIALNLYSYVTSGIISNATIFMRVQFLRKS